MEDGFFATRNHNEQLHYSPDKGLKINMIKISATEPKQTSKVSHHQTNNTSAEAANKGPSRKQSMVEADIKNLTKVLGENVGAGLLPDSGTNSPMA